MKKENKVIVYSTKNCPYCVMAKNFLKEYKIKFIEKMVDENQDEAKEMIQKSGQYGVPVIDINGQIVIGFNEDSLKRLLKIH